MSATVSPQVEKLQKVVLHTPAVISMEEEESENDLLTGLFYCACGLDFQIFVGNRHACCHDEILDRRACANEVYVFKSLSNNL